MHIHLTKLPQRLESIQALRGIAALLVLFFHLAEFQREMARVNASDVALVSGIWDRGWAGVDLFFVISGFIMLYVTREYLNSFRDVRHFLFSRITRIYPLWLVCAGIMAGYFWLTYGMLAAPDRVSGVNEATIYALKSFLLFPQNVPPILGLGWTLIHEMFFYFVFAGLLFLPRKYLPWGLLLWMLMTLVAALLRGQMTYVGSLGELSSSLLSLEFIAGGFAGYLVSQRRLYKPKHILILGLLLALIGLVAFPLETLTSHTTARVLTFALPFALLTYGWTAYEIQSSSSAPRWLTKIGDWSYSLYLTHYIVLVTLRRIYRMAVPENLKVGAEGAVDNLVFAILALSISIVVAAFFYSFVEQPSLRFFKKFKRLKPTNLGVSAGKGA